METEKRMKVLIVVGLFLVVTLLLFQFGVFEMLFIVGYDHQRGITTDGNYIWVVKGNGMEVYKYQMDGTYTGDHWWTLNEDVINPYGIATDGNYIWISDIQEYEIYKYNMDGTYTGIHFDIGASGGTGFNEITTDGNYIWVGTSQTRIVYKYSMDGNYIDSLSVLEGGYSHVDGITKYGNYLYILSGYSNLYGCSWKVSKYLIDGTYSGETLDLPFDGKVSFQGITTDGNYLWVTNRNNDEVYKYEMNGTLIEGGIQPTDYCGDGICQSNENSATCPADCESGQIIIVFRLTDNTCNMITINPEDRQENDYNTLYECESYIEQICGDGICQSNENSATCPSDCGDNQITVYRLTGTTCNQIQINPEDQQPNDYTTLSECENHITNGEEGKLGIGLIIGMIIIGILLIGLIIFLIRYLIISRRNS